MQGVLIGEVLCEMGVLTRQHIEKIVTQQRHTKQKFGQIAVRWGLASQEQIWEAWARQFAHAEQLNLDDAGTDTAAWECLPLETARQYGIVPLRLWGDHLVVAAPADFSSESQAAVAKQTGCHIHFCTTERGSIAGYLNTLSAVPV